jgi:hypothetical protein
MAEVPEPAFPPFNGEVRFLPTAVEAVKADAVASLTALVLSARFRPSPNNLWAEPFKKSEKSLALMPVQDVGPVAVFATMGEDPKQLLGMLYACLEMDPEFAVATFVYTPTSKFYVSSFTGKRPKAKQRREDDNFRHLYGSPLARVFGSEDLQPVTLVPLSTVKTCPACGRANVNIRSACFWCDQWFPSALRSVAAELRDPLFDTEGLEKFVDDELRAALKEIPDFDSMSREDDMAALIDRLHALRLGSRRALPASAVSRASAHGLAARPASRPGSRPAAHPASRPALPS